MATYCHVQYLNRYTIMVVNNNKAFGSISIKKFVVSKKDEQIVLCGEIQADYLKPYAGTLENDVCRKVSWHVNESYWANSDRVYLNEPKIKDEGNWVAVDTWVDFHVDDRKEVGKGILSLLKGLGGMFDEAWSAQDVNNVYDIVNVGTAAEKKVELVLRGGAEKAQPRKSTPCPF